MNIFIYVCIIFLILIIISLIILAVYIYFMQKPEIFEEYDFTKNQQFQQPLDIVFAWEPNRDIDRINRRNNGNVKRTLVIEKNKDPDNLRFECCDEIRYSLRSIDRFFPVYGKLFIVISGKVIPNWLNIKKS